MSQYSDYILQQMSHSRLQDARQQAEADRLCRQSRKAQRRGDAPSRPAILALAQMLVKMVAGWPAKAQG